MMERPLQSLLLVCEALGATQEISFLKPLEGHIQITFVPSAKIKNWIASPTQVDAVVVSRDTTQAGTQIAQWAKSQGIPIIYHIDDDLLDVPTSLGPSKYKHYSDPARVAQLRSNMEASDLIYASTPALKEQFLAHGLTRPIQSGDIYCSVEPETIAAPLPSTGPVFGYMGTAGHAEDLDEIMPAIEHVLTILPTSEFELFGTIERPAKLTRFGDRVRHHSGLANYEMFLQHMHHLGWWVGLAPIADNAFNRCKADTKWVEYARSGTAVVATDLPVYHRACADGCGLLAQSVEDWSYAIMYLLTRPSDRLALIAAARQKLDLRYSQTRLRAQILDVLHQARALSVSSESKAQ